MAQFDTCILFSLIWSLILILIVYYQLSIEVLIPQFAGIGKFREKKLSSLNSFNLFNTSLISKVKTIVWFNDTAVAYQLVFQDPATTTMEGVYLFNFHLLFVIISTVIVVGWLLCSVLINYIEFDNSDGVIFTHSNPAKTGNSNLTFST